MEVIYLAITPLADKKEITRIISEDEFLKSLGFSDEFIYNTNTTDELIQEGNKQIFIYEAPSRGVRNSVSVQCVIQIDVSAPLSQASIVSKAIEQINALLYDRQLGRHSKMELDTYGNLTCPHGFYCKGIRFVYFATKYNEMKKI